MKLACKRFVWTTALALSLASVLCIVSYAQQQSPDGRRAAKSSNSFDSLHWIPATGKSGAIANSSSLLTRNKNGVWYYITTTELLAGGAYTNWWVIFNNPEFCLPPGCGPKDFPQNGGDLNVQASVLWATGRVVDANGQGTFSAHLAAGGVSAAPGQVLFGPALLNPRAEVHLIVRSHGVALTGADLAAQLTTVGGGCKINTCQDQQFVQHFPRGQGE